MYQCDYKAAISNGCLVHGVWMSDVDESVREEEKKIRQTWERPGI